MTHHDLAGRTRARLTPLAIGLALALSANLAQAEQHHPRATPRHLVDHQHHPLTRVTSLKERLRDKSGVNVDDELTRMIQLQNSYSASARVMTTVTQMFDDLLRLAG